MLVVLEAIAGPIAGRKIEVRAGSILRLGRTARSDYAIGEDSYLSGQHFAVECDGVQCRIRDLGSSNGTFVNGDRITEVVVREGDSLMAGESTFTVHMESSPAGAKAAVADDRTRTAPTPLYSSPRTRFEKTVTSPGGIGRAGFSTAQAALLRALYLQGDDIYAMLDATRDSRIPAFLEASGEPYQSLTFEDRIAAYVVSVPSQSRLLDVLVKDGWSRGWGFYFAAAASLAEVSAHWVRYLQVYTADGFPITFRFWDPRVLRALAPLMPAAEIAHFFGPVHRIIVEGEKPEIAIEILPTARGGRQQTVVLV
jgi:hypothetical protein